MTGFSVFSAKSTRCFVFYLQNGTTIALVSEQLLGFPQHLMLRRVKTSSSSGIQRRIERGTKGHGYRQSEPEDFHGFRSRQPDRNLRRSLAQFCQEPPFGLYRASRGTRRNPSGSVAVYAFGFDGAGHAVSALHALRRSALRIAQLKTSICFGLPGFAGRPFLLFGAIFSLVVESKTQAKLFK